MKLIAGLDKTLSSADQQGSSAPPFTKDSDMAESSLGLLREEGDVHAPLLLVTPEPRRRDPVDDDFALPQRRRPLSSSAARRKRSNSLGSRAQCSEQRQRRNSRRHDALERSLRISVDQGGRAGSIRADIACSAVLSFP